MTSFVVLQMEIPISDVINVTREKTAYIIPNAIGIVTLHDKVCINLSLTAIISVAYKDGETTAKEDFQFSLFLC